jgi:hypothetical protein
MDDLARALAIAAKVIAAVILSEAKDLLLTQPEKQILRFAQDDKMPFGEQFSLAENTVIA